ncbi:uncharacterized protein LOC119461565 [Dermacentor silvarum]|uniref:uncharacterized protein LOC119461565 n=1 Tax=Dermacentor silvarum TaxID=543639 RepID=UPI00189AB7E8|nr:uncharacterized protein LOC119461565 [Dermacentor silvarum]
MAGPSSGTSGLQLLLPLVLLAAAAPSRAQSADQEWQRRVLERRQVEQLPPAAMPEPSCAQLRLMWRQMHRMARHSQLTNEIPQFPASYPFGYVSPDDKALMFWTPASFGKVVRQPGQKPVSVVNPGRPSVAGRFAQTPLPRSALGSSYGTVVRSPSEKAALRRQMAAATGSWGPFTPPDRGSDAGVVSKTRVLYRSEQERCGRSVMGRTCHSHDDCFCPGLKFFCSAGRCRSPASRKASKDQWGTWYSGPLEVSRLGMMGKARNRPGPATSNDV